MTDFIQGLGIILVAIGVMANTSAIRSLSKRVSLINIPHQKIYQKLTNVDEIEKDFEKSARLREMRDANRTTLPRENTGPPAKVYRPKLRGKRPSGWNPPRA